MKTIVVSGITLRKGGTLTILRDTLAYLSQLAESGEYRIVALVNRKDLCAFPNIEYIEVPLKGWIGRLWYEYVTMHKISKEIGPVYLWLSMHDVTPRVVAERQAVYCQTSFPFYKWKWRDFRFDPKIPMFAMLTRYYYKARVKKNKYLIVQQEWLREGLSKMLGVDKSKFIVAPPEKKTKPVDSNITSLAVEDNPKDKHNQSKKPYSFFYASTADCHKNFETLCKAAKSLEKELGKGKFEVVITIKGDENKYAQWLHKNWGKVSSIHFSGLMNKETLFEHYRGAKCLVFPSNIETWGLPITEYMEANGGAMILSDLAYAHNTAKGSRCTAFFRQDDANHLKELMKEAIYNDFHHFSELKENSNIKEPYARSWKELFDLLLE